MTNVNSGYGIYPKLEVEKPITNVEDWRLKSCFNFEKEIKNNVEKYTTTLKQLKKQKKKLKTIVSVMIGCATSLSIGGAAVSSTGFGTIVGIPLIGVSIGFGFFSQIPNTMQNNVFKEILKNEKLLILVSSKLSTMRKMINKSLNDNVITEEEFKYIEYEFNEYKTMENESSRTSEKKEKKLTSKDIQRETVKNLVTIVESLSKKE